MFCGRGFVADMCGTGGERPVFLRLHVLTRWLWLSANGNTGSARSRAQEAMHEPNVLIAIHRVDAGRESIHLGCCG
jgi:hypothetical protein